ncbi:IS1 family transposase [Geomonas propionica]|uniref:IS1 family transposase n=1 Tax=Geomonas propionica TaxID=2798582 RepID=A0ABS0YLK1_9BACT|nr:IS1 family transposase [Geomonas propionica]MBJ6798632.1 IS1 family transposase [Geomonas propionica]
MKTVGDIVLELKSEFTVDVLDEDACRAWFLRKLHLHGAHCPECGREVVSERKLATFWGLGRVKCSDESCNKTFSALTGTVLSGLGIEFRALYLLLFMAGCGVNVNRIAPQLGISVSAAYLWAKKAKPMRGGVDA